MLLAPRKFLFATNIFALFFILILQKCLQLFCIIEEKTCGNANCTPAHRCDAKNCATPAASRSPSPVAAIRYIPAALRKTMLSLGYVDGQYRVFLEIREQNHPSRAHLNAAVAEVKLNPN